MSVRVAIAAAWLVCAAGHAAGQDIDFSPAPSRDCLDALPADETAARAACIGKSFEACTASPDGYTTVGMGWCYQREADFWDGRLNAAYRELRDAENAMKQEMEEVGATVPDTVGPLRDMQRAWIAFRDASCVYEYSTWGGGSGGGPAYAGCVMEMTARQAIELERRLAERKR